MAWTTPRTWVAAENVSATIMNTHVRDNLSETAPAKATASGRLIVSAGANTLAERVPTGDSVSTSENTTSTSYTDLTTAGPAVTVTTGTSALVIITAQVSNSSAGARASMGYAISGATTLAASSSRSLLYESGAANDLAQFSYVGLVTGLTAGSNTFTSKYLATSGTATFANRALQVIPF